MLNTFSEKIRFKMNYDRNPLLKIFANKLLVRDFVRDKVGEHLLPELYVAARCLDLIDFSMIPDQFVLKVNHGSGGG